jgi:hypothetical protein
MNLIEQVEALVEARIREDAPARGNLLTTAECLREAREEQLAVLPPALQKQAPARGLAGREFEAFFASDAPVHVVPFTVAGNRCEVRLKRMPPTDVLRLMAMIEGIAATGAGADSAQAAEMADFLIRGTLQGGTVYQRCADAPERWEPVSIPSDPEARAAFVRDRLQPDIDVWSGLIEECMALYSPPDEETQGNSTSS